MQLSMQMFDRFAPNVAKRRDNLKGPPFEEAALPVKRRNYAADISCLGVPKAESSDIELLGRGISYGRA